MTNRQLLERIEKLEQAVQDIRTSCPCLFMNQEPEKQECPGSVCFECGHSYGLCICEPELPEEPEDGITYCPEPTCPRCDCEDCICEPEDIDEDPEDQDCDKEITHD